jgi:hypothetical protein
MKNKKNTPTTEKKSAKKGVASSAKKDMIVIKKNPSKGIKKGGTSTPAAAVSTKFGKGSK